MIHKARLREIKAFTVSVGAQHSAAYTATYDRNIANSHITRQTEEEHK